MNWKNFQSDPNNESVQKSRKNAILLSRSPILIEDREEFIAQRAAGKRVLDVGVVAHTSDAYESDKWLHRHVRERATYCLGCDVLGPEIEVLRQRGFNVICHDITKAPLNDRFDLIILGEIIEHIDRPGEMLANCREMLREDGKVILTTPNPWFVTFALKGLLCETPLVESVDHVAWYDPSTLCELASRFGFRLERFTGIKVTQTYTLRAKILFGIFATIGKLFLRREAFAKSIIYELVRT